MSSFDVCVQGSGPVGMSLALALSRLGLNVAWRAEVPAASAAGDVRTYALSATSVELLEQLKVWPALAADARTPVLRMQIEGDAPGAGLQFSAPVQGLPQLTWIVDAAELERALREALKFAHHVQPVDAEVPATLQALAEGRDAAGRQARGVSVQVHRYGQRALAARLVADRPHEGIARQWFRAPDVLALLPFDRPRNGHAYGLVWSLPEDRAQALQALEPAAFEAELDAATQQRAGRLQLASPVSGWPLLHAQADRLCGPGWVLLGDAAHVVHPLAGQGLNLGLADVKALAETLAAREPFRSVGDEKLLRRYARLRHGPVQAMGRLTDGLLELFAHPHPVARELRNRGMSLVNSLPPLKRLLTQRAMRS
ncbi:MAG: FAD-dependent monooxygenase [Rubrivivax sp.]|nr:FAD-dependent monooxygenase [Rubrivivax sp.]